MSYHYEFSIIIKSSNGIISVKNQAFSNTSTIVRTISLYLSALIILFFEYITHIILLCMRHHSAANYDNCYKAIQYFVHGLNQFLGNHDERIMESNDAVLYVCFQ